MSRITSHLNSRMLVLRFEGRLDAQSVAVLDECWREAAAARSQRRTCIDLTGVTFIDAAGKARLAELHGCGAEFVGGNLMTNAIVAEIVGS